MYGSWVNYTEKGREDTNDGSDEDSEVEQDAQVDHTDEDEDVDRDVQEVLDLTTSSSKMRQVIQDTSVFDDPSKSYEDWWLEDTSREVTLCQLWFEERALYDSSLKAHMTEDRTTILKRFSTILQVPGEYKNLKMWSYYKYEPKKSIYKNVGEYHTIVDRQASVNMT